MERINGKKLIVGLDPGTTCGIAVIGLDMKPILLTSIRGANRDEVIKAISGAGEPILIACDVANPPGFVRKVASLFEAGLFAPKRDMTIHEKRRIVEDHFPSLIKGLDAHSLDALAAALKAYLGYKNKFESVEARLRKLLRPETLEEIRAEIIRGVRLTHIISREIGKLEDEPKEKVVKVYVRDRDKGDSDSRLGNSRDRLVELLRWENRKLKAELKRLKTERDNLERALRKRLSEEYWSFRRDAVYRVQEKEIADLRRRLSEAEHRIEELSKPKEALQISEELIPLREVSSFTYDEVEKIRKTAGKGEGPYIMLLNAAGGGPSTARRLAEAKPRVVVRCTEMSHQAEEVLAENGIPVIPSDSLEVRYLQGTPVVERRALEERIKEYKRSRINARVAELIESIRKGEIE